MRWPGHRRTVIGLKRGWIQAVCILFILLSVTTVGIGADVSVSYTVLPYVALSGSKGDYAPHEQALLVFPSITDSDWERGFAQRVESVDLTVIANTSWTLTAQLLSPARAIGSEGALGGTAALSWATRPNGVYTEIAPGATGIPQTVSFGERGSHQLSLWYRVDLQPFQADAAEIEAVEAVIVYTVVAE